MGIGRPHLAAAILVAISLAGCGVAGPSDARVPHPVLVVVNKCDSKMEGGDYVFPLKELRLHTALGNYGAATNRLSAPLDPGEEMALAEPAIQPGTWYVTVFRPMGPWQPQLVAVTGANPIELGDGTYRLLVYEEAFYLYPPSRPDGPWRERGAPDRSFDRRPVDAGTVDRGSLQ